MTTQKTWVLVALLLVGTTFAVGAVAAHGVTTSQTPSESTVAPGGELQVSVTVNATGYNSPALDLTLPAGWTVIEHADDGGTYKDSTQQWVWLDSGVKTVTYTVAVPANATTGSYELVANGSAIDPETEELVADETVSTVRVGEGTPTETTTQTATPTETATPTQTATQTVTPTQTATPAADRCDPDSPAELETARLFTREDTIETGQPGIIAGGFLPPTGLQCDIVVRVTLQVPNNMYVQGTDGLGSGGAGLVSNEFTIPADTSSVQSVRAEVYASETGQLRVTGDITYWPEGNPDLQSEISGLTLTFDVNEPVERGAAGTNTATDGGDDSTGTGIPGLSGVTALVAVAATVVVALRRRTGG